MIDINTKIPRKRYEDVSTTFSIRLEANMVETLDNWAVITGYSRNKVVVMLLERAMKENDPRTLFIDELDKRLKKK